MGHPAWLCHLSGGVVTGVIVFLMMPYIKLLSAVCGLVELGCGGSILLMSKGRKWGLQRLTVCQNPDLRSSRARASTGSRGRCLHFAMVMVSSKDSHMHGRSGDSNAAHRHKEQDRQEAPSNLLWMTQMPDAVADFNSDSTLTRCPMYWRFAAIVDALVLVLHRG